MQIVVTGHKGFIGSYLMPKLPADTTGLDIKEGNDILTCKLPEADIVIHLAAEPGVVKSMQSPITSARTNIMGTLRLIRHYKNAKFIFASSGGTIQETIESPYGLTKYVGEEYIKLLHNNYVILRFCNVYGEGSRSVVDKWLKEKELTIYGDGLTNRIYGHVSDIVEAILLSMDWPQNNTYKLGSDQRYSVNQIAQAIGKPFIHVGSRAGEITHDRSELLNETPNWQPKVDLMEYIKNVEYRNSI
jgi:UDP-glucose 4-epimerase